MADTLTFTAVAEGEARFNAYILDDQHIYTVNEGEWLLADADGEVHSFTGDWSGTDALGITNLTGQGITIRDLSINTVPVTEGLPFTADNFGEFIVSAFDAGAVAPEPEPVPGQLVTGTGAANVLTGGEGPDTISGLGGDDSMSGAGGDDVLRGGGGADLLDGGPGDDIISTGSGRDTVLFDPTEPGSDVVTDFQLGFDIVRIVGDVGDPVLEPVTTEGGGVGTRIGFEDYPDADMTIAGASNLVEATIIA